jgi:hypothetical protein
MPSPPRGRDAATTTLAVVLAIALALLWLHSADTATPAVPAGLSVATVPAVATEEAAPPTTGIEGEKAGGNRAAARKPKREHAGRKQKRGHADRAKRGRADRAGGAEDARARVGDPGARARRRQDPPATAPAPSAGSVGAGSVGAGSAPAAPEFALE